MNNQNIGINSDQVFNPKDLFENQEKSSEIISKLNENRKIYLQPKRKIRPTVNIYNNQNQLLIQEVISEQKSPVNSIALDYLQ